MNIMTYVCLVIAIAYSVPIVIGGIRGRSISSMQSLCWALGWTGFVYFGGFLK